MEFLSKALSVLPYVIAINLALSGVGAGLAVLKDKSPALGKIGDIIAGVSAFLKKIIDFGSANLPH